MSASAVRGCLLAAGLAPLLAQAAPRDAVVEQPRPFGHAIGDVVTQRVRVDGSSTSAPAALAVPARAGAWFERQAVRLESAPDGTRWLAVDYQVVNVPAAPATLLLPAWELPAADGGAALHVAAAPVGVAPIAPLLDDGFALRPDRPPPPVALGPLRHALAQAVAATAAIALAGSGWWAWRERRARAAQPFARALVELDGAADDAADDAAMWRALHLAFDRTAGEVLRPSTLHRLFDRAPHLAGRRGEIERFYAQSAARFFGGSADAGAGTVEPVSPRALCRALRRLERSREP